MPPYQLDFITPGSSPLRARFLKQILHMSNFPMNPLGLPQIAHLFLALVLNLTAFLNFSIMLFLAMRPPLSCIWPHIALNGPERHTHQPQKLIGFFIRFCRRPDGDVHAAYLVNLVVFDLREDNLLAQPYRVVSPSVKRLGRNPFEVPH